MSNPWKFHPPVATNPSVRELRAVIQRLGGLPKPRVNAIHVRSKQEVSALLEFVETARNDDTPPYLRWMFALSIPVHIVEDTPPGIVRAMLNDEIVADHPVR